MGFQPDLYHQLRVARLLGISEVGAKGRTAEPREGAILHLEPELEGWCHGVSSPGPGLCWPVGVTVPRDKLFTHLDLNFQLR